MLVPWQGSLRNVSLTQVKIGGLGPMSMAKHNPDTPRNSPSDNTEIEMTKKVIQVAMKIEQAGWAPLHLPFGWR